MPSDIEVEIDWVDSIPLGSSVYMADGTVKGIVAGIAVYLNGSVLYEVVYWINSERKEVWVGKDEVKVDNKENHISSLKFGYRPRPDRS